MAGERGPGAAEAMGACTASTTPACSGTVVLLENTGMLGDADEQDLADCFAELGVKKLHQTADRE